MLSAPKLTKLTKLTKLFVTLGYLGFSKKAPGTIASLVTATVSYLLLKFYNFGFGFEACLFLLVLSSVLGFISVKSYIITCVKKDPQEVVIDEFAGQILAIVASYLFIKHNGSFFEEKIVIISFLFFRLFDITKIFPINYFDQMDNAFGIMMDDIVAGILAFMMVFLTMQVI